MTPLLRDLIGLVLVVAGMAALGFGTVWAVSIGGWPVGATLVGGMALLGLGRWAARYDPEVARVHRELREAARSVVEQEAEQAG